MNNNKLTFKDLKKTLKLRRDTRLEMAQYKAAKLQEAKDFWNTPFDELIEQGYGVEMIDPKDSYIFDLDNNLH